jgi:hypothetical protein
VQNQSQSAALADVAQSKVHQYLKLAEEWESLARERARLAKDALRMARKTRNRAIKALMDQLKRANSSKSSRITS